MKPSSTVWSALLTAVALSATGTASAGPAPETNAFVTATNTVSSTAACLVSAANPTPGINACLCAASNFSFGVCGTAGEGTFGVNPAFTVGWAAALKTDQAVLSAGLTAGDNDVVMNAYGSCGLTAASLELALDTPANARRDKNLKGILGGQASYSAVYMFPVKRPFGSTSEADWTSAGDPVRLCSYGQATAFLTGSFQKEGEHKKRDDDSKKSKGYGLTAGLSAIDVGITGAFEWVADNDGSVDQEWGVRYLVVAGVADGILQANTTGRVDAIGVVANSRISDRALHLRTETVTGGLQPTIP